MNTSEEYQKKLLKHLRKYGKSAILAELPSGAGKSVIISDYVEHLQKQRDELLEALESLFFEGRTLENMKKAQRVITKAKG